MSYCRNKYVILWNVIFNMIFNQIYEAFVHAKLDFNADYCFCSVLQQAHHSILGLF